MNPEELFSERLDGEDCSFGDMFAAVMAQVAGAFSADAVRARILFEDEAGSIVGQLTIASNREAHCAS
jgi:hypothetical protein